MTNILKHFQRLKRLYKIGLIDYPRVENDYKTEYNYFAHPKLFGFSDEFKPVKEKKIKIKIAPMFFLFHRGILTPALIENFILFLSKKKKKYEKDNDKRMSILLKITTPNDFLQGYKKYKFNLFKLEKKIYKINDAYFINADFTVKRLLEVKSALKREENNIKYIDNLSLKEIFKKEEQRQKILYQKKQQRKNR